MEYEKHRLSTFVIYPKDATVSALMLADSGFVCTRYGSEVTCSLCEWHTAHFRTTFCEILRKHARLSPKCPVVQGIAYANVKWSAEPKADSLKKVYTRNNFKTGMSKSSSLSEKQLIDSSPNLNQNRRNVNVSKTINTNARSSSLPRGASITTGVDRQITSKSVEERYPHTQTDTLGESQAVLPSIPTAVQAKRLSANQHPEFTNIDLVFPSVSREVPDPQALSPLPNLRNEVGSANDNNDSFEIGQGFSYSDLGIVIKKSKQPKYAPRSERHKTFVSCPKEYRLLHEEPFKTLGHNAVARDRLIIKGEDRLSEDHTEVSAKCTRETLEAIQKENNEHRDKTLCRICWDKKFEVLFTPCGHLLSCTECAATLNLCPICRFEIKGKARIILC